MFWALELLKEWRQSMFLCLRTISVITRAFRFLAALIAMILQKSPWINMALKLQALAFYELLKLLSKETDVHFVRGNANKILLQGSILAMVPRNSHAILRENMAHRSCFDCRIKPSRRNVASTKRWKKKRYIPVVGGTFGKRRLQAKMSYKNVQWSAFSVFNYMSAVYANLLKFGSIYVYRCKMIVIMIKMKNFEIWFARRYRFQRLKLRAVANNQ